MPKDRDTHWQFACPECGFGHAEIGALAADDEIYCLVCLEEAGRYIIILHRWPAESVASEQALLSVRRIAA